MGRTFKLIVDHKPLVISLPILISSFSVAAGLRSTRHRVFAAGFKGNDLDKELHASMYDGVYLFSHKEGKQSFYPIDFQDCLTLVVDLGLAGKLSISKADRKKRMHLEWVDEDEMYHQEFVSIFAKVCKGK